jgi:AraC family transcriptional regulator
MRASIAAVLQKTDSPTAWKDAIEERRSLAPAAALQSAAQSGFEIEWLLLRPCVFPTSIVRDLCVIATLGSGFVIEIEHGRRIYTDHGEICLLSPSLKRRASFPQRGEVLRISYDDELVRQVAAEIGMTDVLDALTYQKLTDPAVYEIVHMLAEEMRPGGARAPMYSTSLALTLLGYVLRGCPAAQQRGSVGEPGLSPQRLARSRQYVENRLGGDLTVGEIARAVDMSLFHFARAFKQSTGKTPHAYVLERRIAAAQSLVLNTTRPLNEISAELGFSNPSHFSAVFGRLTGTSPSAYRLRGAEGARPRAESVRSRRSTR